MFELKHSPVKHDHAAFLGKAATRKGFSEAYDSLELEYQVVSQFLMARAEAGLPQEAVAQRMSITKNAASRLESAGVPAPRHSNLKRYANAVGCELQVKTVPQR